MSTPMPTPAPQGSFFEKYAAGSNNPTGMKRLEEALQQTVRIFSGETLISLGVTVATAEDAVAHLCVAAKIIEADNLMSILSEIDKERGNSFGARLLNWVVRAAEVHIPDTLTVIWGAFHQQMASTIEMMWRTYQPVGPVTHGSVLDWISHHGGIGKLHATYMRVCQNEKREQKERAERQRLRGERLEQEEAAQAAGFATIEEHKTSLAAAAKEEQQQKLSSQFDQVKQSLVENGTPIATPPSDGCHLLVVCDGQLYALSPDDERSLLACAASNRI